MIELKSPKCQKLEDLFYGIEYFFSPGFEPFKGKGMKEHKGTLVGALLSVNI